MNLDKIFNPKSIAVIGASSQKGSVGFGLLRNVLEGKRKRKVFAVNLKRKNILGLKCFSSVKDIKENIDLAIIAVPRDAVLNIVGECCDKQVGGIIIISAGFSEKDEKGKILQGQIKERAKLASIPLVGPNCLGVIRPSAKLNASFAPASPKVGNIGFISQSGALIDSIIDKSLEENYGFSTLVSVGNQVVLSVTDFLELLDNDEQTKVIVLYIEGISDGVNFLQKAKDISKPIVVIKAGKTESGKNAISSHTGSLAGEYEVYKAAFKQAGIIEVNTIEELLDTAKTLAWQPKIKNSIGIVTNGGGCGVLLTDYCQELGINLVSSVDVLGDALSDKYKIEIEKMLARNDIEGLIVVQTLQIMTEIKKNAKIIIDIKKKYPNKAIVCAFLGGKLTKPGVDFLEKNKIPNYPDLKRAAKSMSSLLFNKEV